MAEKDVFYQDSDYLLREFYIRKKGKGNALNEGLCHARNDLVCILDADCVLQEDALSKAVKHFRNDEVVAVGGRLLVKREDSCQLEAIQSCEYMKTFQISRSIFARLNAQCLISGAFGVFRKSTLLGINGYDIDTVGEDMELVLRLQEKDYQQSKKANEMDGPAFKIKDDPRITRVGKFIRKTSIDELPQLWNILKGDMSIVGPRPALPREVEQYKDIWKQRMYITPGLTCYWQIAPNRNDISFDDWMKLDMKYIEERSFWVDWKIILMTVKAVVFRQGR